MAVQRERKFRPSVSDSENRLEVREVLSAVAGLPAVHLALPGGYASTVSAASVSRVSPRVYLAPQNFLPLTASPMVVDSQTAAASSTSAGTTIVSPRGFNNFLPVPPGFGSAQGNTNASPPIVYGPFPYGRFYA